MLFKKALAVLSAIAVIGSCSIYNGGISTFTAAAEIEAVSDADTETCSAVVSMSELADPIPEGAHIKAQLVRVGDEETVIEQWELTQDGVKDLSGLEYSEEFSYKIVFSDLPEGYGLPEKITVMFDKKGDTDNIVLCGRSAERAETEKTGLYNNVEISATPFYFSDNLMFMTDLLEDSIIEKYIVDENGVRYCGLGGITVPDGHYTAYVIPDKAFRFVQYNTEAAAAIINSKSWYDKRINTDYFNRDFSKGFEFDVKNGTTDTLLNFYLENIPEEKEVCTADISVVDSETGEPVDGIKLELTNERLFEDGYITWDSSDTNPMSLDKLLCLGKNYTVAPLNTSETYYIPSVSFSFSKLGEHKDVVIKAKRKTNLDVPKVVLPDEAPVPVDDAHCAVTVGVMDNDGKPAQGVTATLYKKVKSTKTTLMSWNAEEEPVKTINDIEFDESADYYVAISGESNDYYRYDDMKLAFSKGGDSDKVVQFIFPTSMRSIKIQRTVHDTGEYGNVSMTSSGWGGIMVVDMQGYRYPFTNNHICLPDGEYLLKTVTSSSYRIIRPGTEIEAVLVNSDPSLKGYFEQNVENYKNGFKFTVKNGVCEDEIKFYAEYVPTFKNSCSADITVVDDETGEPIEGVNVVMDIPYGRGQIGWNTAETSVMKFDYLRFTDADYRFTVTDLPENYTYGKKEPLSFAKYGEHQDFEIKLSKTTKKGDANCDGTVELADAILIMQAIANPDKYGVEGSAGMHITEQGTVNGDVDPAVKGITSNDALRIQMYLLHQIDTLTAEE